MAPPAFLTRIFDETLDLLVEARNYAIHMEAKDQPHSTGVDGLKLSCESMRVTSRLTQVMAWLLIQRAADAGEISPDEALADHNRLSGADVCLDEELARDETLPQGLRSLMERSLNLYRRISRLENQMLERR